jgi:hypothetical protein
VGEVHLHSTDGGRDVARDLAHAVAFVARPAGEREVEDAAGARVRRERSEEEEVDA